MKTSEPRKSKDEPMKQTSLTGNFAVEPPLYFQRVTTNLLWHQLLKLSIDNMFNATMNGKPKVEVKGLGVLMFKLPITGCIALILTTFFRSFRPNNYCSVLSALNFCAHLLISSGWFIKF